MCTVTFLPFRDRVLLTSNRDEKLVRETAVLPEARSFESGEIIFPCDGKAGGTWIAMHNNGNIMVLLNGAFEKHEARAHYRKSRGLIFLEVFDADNPVINFQNTDLEGIEPFTLVLWMHNSLFEMKWDGDRKYIIPRPFNVPQIWSSVTLYDKEVIEKRKQWFNKWLTGKKNISTEDIRKFHEFAGDGDLRNDLKMNRDGEFTTVSITGIEVLPAKGTMHYRDLQAGLTSIHEWLFIPKHLSV